MVTHRYTRRDLSRLLKIRDKYHTRIELYFILRYSLDHIQSIYLIEVPITTDPLHNTELQIHRKDGPAIICCNGNTHYVNHGCWVRRIYSDGISL
jgi:hypothetical protein